MKRLIPFLFLLVCAQAQAQTGSVKTQTDLNTEIGTPTCVQPTCLFPSSGQQQINAYYLRQGLLDIVASMGARPFTVAFVANGSAGVTWTNMPASAAFYNGNARIATKADLTAFTQARLIVNLGGTVAASGATLELQYATTAPYTIGSYSAIGSSAASVNVNNSGTTNTVLDSGWVNLVSGAQADVYLAIVGAGGDGAADPIFGNIIAHFR